MTVPKRLPLLFSCYRLLFRELRIPRGILHKPKRRGPSQMKVNLSWQKKAIVLFTGITIILSALLATLAIQEARRQKASGEKEIVRDLQRSGELIIDHVQAVILETEKRIGRMLPGDDDQTQDEGLAELCRRVMNEEDIVDEIFLMDGKGRVFFPHRKPLFFLADEEEKSKKISLSLETSDLFRTAENAEFRSQDYSLAITTYHRLINGTRDKNSQAVLLNCIGRCYAKAGQPIRALKAYHQVLEQGPNERSLEGIPLGIIAQYQIGRIGCDIQEEDNGLQMLFELYDGLLESRWPLSENQFHFYRNQVKTAVEASLAEMNDLEQGATLRKRWDRLRQLEDERLKRASSRRTFVQRVIPILKAEEPSSGRTNTTFHHLSRRIEDDSYLISYIPIPGRSILGLRLNPKAILAELSPLKLERPPLRKDWQVQIRDETGTALLGSHRSPLKPSASQAGFSMSFLDDFPPWRVDIHQSDPDRLDRQFNRRRNVYVLCSLVVMVALFFGGFHWIRSTGNELKLAELKSYFVSTVSHEFKTPLTSIRYLSELLQRGRVKDEEKKQQYYRTISSESGRLNRLIENILDFSKIEAGMKKYQFEETDMGNLVKDVASRFQSQAAHRTFPLKTDIADPMPGLSADREAVSRALFNLLDNAFKYSGENPEIILRAWSDEETLFLEVQDNGRGISEGEQKKVFEKFYRPGGGGESQVKGSGIGLTLVADIVKAHGGRVSLESHLGMGTRVTLAIPINQVGVRNG